MTEEKKTTSSAKSADPADKIEEVKNDTIVEDGVIDVPTEAKNDSDAGKPEELPDEIKKKLEKQKAARTPMKGKRKKKGEKETRCFWKSFC